MDVDSLLQYRREKDDFLRHDEHSPVSPAQRSSFTGLRYYAPNERLALHLPVEPADGGELTVETSDGSRRVYLRSGVVRFEVDGRPASLLLLATPDRDGWFVPFRDATSGTETYAAGRYLDLSAARDGLAPLDFNYAYNPFCAYSDAYSCPLPPPENWLDVPIRAGEMAYDPAG